MFRAIKTVAIVVGAVVISLTTGDRAFAQAISCQGRLILPLDFQSPTLVSGTALQPGATYRYSGVATGVDALVTINAITNGSLTTVDRDTGLVANFQPELSAAGGTGGPRSADFTIALVLAGTSTPVAADFAASGIDIDGDSGALREYAEFSDTMAEYALETPTRLSVNASGPSVPSNIRFEASTTFTAPGIDPTATQNIVSAFYTNASSIDYRIGTLGNGGTTRLTSLDFNCPNINFPTSNPQVDQDFGDAPVSSYGDPRHDHIVGIRIGATNTIETAPYDSPTASGDLGDDGAAMPILNRGQVSTIDVAVTGAGGLLQAWIDFGANGDFTSASDQVATNVSDGGVDDADGAINGVIRLAFTTPSGASPGTTFARFRWSTQANIDAAMTASDGEVEDYQITVSNTPPPAICPAGQSVVNQTGNAVAIEDDISVANQNRALGPLSAAGTSPPDPASAEMNNNNDLLTLDLGVGVPQNALMTISLARDNGGQGNNGRVDVLFSVDDVTYVSSATYGASPADFVSAAQNVLEHNDFVVPVAGARYVRFNTLNNDDIFIDGVEYAQICTISADLDAQKSVSIYDPSSAGLFAVPGNEVIYAITATNSGAGAVDVDTIFLVDALPSEVEFFNGDFDDAGPGTGAVEFSQTGAGLTFSEATDLRFSNAAAAPANFAACTYNAAPGYDPSVRYVCFNPKGAMAAGSPDPAFTVRFRARIR